MAFNNEYQDFCDRWLEKAKTYQETDLNQCFDKYFTLFVVYNALYVETAALLRRKAISEGRDEYKHEGGNFPDSKAATEYVLGYLKSRFLLDNLEADANSKESLGRLANLMELGQFYISLDPVWGDPQEDKDKELLASLKSNDIKKRSSAILQIVYNVRCNMFHGRKGLNPVQMELLTPLIHILEKIIDLLYKKLKNENYIPKPTLAENS